MGKWFAGLLSNDNKEVVLHGRNETKLKEAGSQLGLPVTTHLSEAVNGADMIGISVPIDNFEQVCKDLQPFITAEQTVVDVTSVKSVPVGMMQKYLGTDKILGTHPIFGPGAKGLRHQNFVLTPTNDSESAIAGKIKDYLEQHGASVSVMTPLEHDRMMSVILGLSHFIAIVSADTLLNFSNLKRMAEIGGPTYKVLLTLAESVLTEDPELYASLQLHIPGLEETEAMFLRSTTEFAEIVRHKNRKAFIERMNALKGRLAQDDPDFGKSYEDMYDLLEEKP